MQLYFLIEPVFSRFLQPLFPPPTSKLASFLTWIIALEI